MYLPCAFSVFRVLGPPRCLSRRMLLSMLGVSLSAGGWGVASVEFRVVGCRV